MTKRIAALERRVGQPLLERGRSGYGRPPAGRALYPEARAALAALDRARRVLGDADPSSALAVAASHTVAGYLLPEWLAGFRAARGSLRIAVEVVNSPGVLAAVRAERAGLGFVEGIDSLEGLESQMLMTDELECVVRPGHRFARRAAIRPAELLDEPWIAREPASGTRAVAERALRERGIVLVRALEAASTEGLKRAVLGGGFALLSRLAVEEEVANGSLAAVPVQELRPAPRAARGRELTVPVAVGATPELFIVVLPWGAGTNWARNVLAAGGCVVRWKGADHPAGRPEVVGRRRPAPITRASNGL